MLKTRLRQFLDLVALSRLARNPWRAYGYLRRGRQPDRLDLHFGGMEISARKQDWSSVREVLIEDEYRCLDHLFGRSDRPRVLDLGANIGCFALRTFSRLPHARVASVEAADDTADVLEQNRRSNPDLDWTVIRGAVWKSDGPLHLSRMGNSASHRVGNGAGMERVEGLSLDTILARLGWDGVDLVKMDIEGAESEVVSSASEILAHTDKLTIEIHDDRIDGDEVLRHLARSFSCWHKLTDRKSTKPLLLLSKSPVSLPPAWAEAIDAPHVMPGSATPVQGTI